MNTNHTRTKLVTAAVSAAIATIAAPALLFLGGTAQATPDISARGPVGIIGDLPTPRGCNGCDGFNPQSGTPDYPNLFPALTPDPDDTVGTHIGKGIASGIGNGTASPAPELSRRT